MLEGRPIQARPVGPVGRFVRWSKREPAKAALLGVLLVALPVIATLVTSHVKDRPQVEAARLAKIEQEKDEILSEASYEVSEGDPKKAVALYTQVLEMEGSLAGGGRRARARAPQAASTPRPSDSSRSTGRCSATARPPTCSGLRPRGSRQERRRRGGERPGAAEPVRLLPARAVADREGCKAETATGSVARSNS